MLSRRLPASVSPGRDVFRAYPLDGARLYFHPRTGTHVRVRSDATANDVRRAPRVIMFGITNACNLRCTFCSRDVRRDSAWSVDTAATALEGLADAGALEVAFGGGEPFAFRGFDELVARLHATTPLALHVTTNGTLVNDVSWRPFRGRFGQVRISIYAEVPWQDAARVLTASRQLWGANVLVDDARLPSLPSLFADLAARGCHDVSILSYVGGDRAQPLSLAGEHALAAMIADAPLPCRLSVCMGDRVPTPRLFSGADGLGDCGAGYDFVSITPDKRVQSCSFQDESLPGATADEVLAAWRTRRAWLARATPRQGCARALPTAPPEPPPRLAAWRAFAGNNSGECILVGKFEAAEDAESFVTRLLPGWVPDEAVSPEWRELFVHEGVGDAATIDTLSEDGELAPKELVAVGRSVLATSYGAGDSLLHLRALTWKKAGYVVGGGVHVHDDIPLVAAIRCANANDARALAPPATFLDGATTQAHVHGHTLFVVVPCLRVHDDGPLRATCDAVTRLAAGRPLAAELAMSAIDEPSFLEVLKRLGVALPRTPRIAALFWGPKGHELARTFAGSDTGERATVAGATVLFEAARRRRIAVRALRLGGAASPLEGDVVRVRASLWFPAPVPRKGQKAEQPAPIDAARLRAALTAAFQSPVDVEAPMRNWRAAVDVQIATNDPARAMTAIATEASILGCELNLYFQELNPLAWLVRRLIADVEAATPRTT